MMPTRVYLKKSLNWRGTYHNQTQLSQKLWLTLHKVSVIQIARKERSNRTLL